MAEFKGVEVRYLVPPPLPLHVYVLVGSIHFPLKLLYIVAWGEVRLPPIRAPLGPGKVFILQGWPHLRGPD